jgi:ribose-phosphate pyrophosphokinase
MLILNLDPTVKSWENLTRDPIYHSDIDGYINYKKFIFSGGEVHIKLTSEGRLTVNKVLITHRINNSQNLMELLLAADAVRRQFANAVISAFIPYLPYARQDRPMVEGEPFSLKVFVNLLKTANFNKVFTLDPHSDVSPALIDNLEIIEPYYLKQTFYDIRKEYGDEILLVAPDGGALKKIYNHAKYIEYKDEIICATKHRDVSNGKILRTEIPDGSYGDFGAIWIMDDICDGGRTFIELAKILKMYGGKRVVLSVSHAIVSHGEEELKKYIDKIYSTVSVKNDESDLIKRYEI